MARKPMEFVMRSKNKNVARLNIGDISHNRKPLLHKAFKSLSPTFSLSSESFPTLLIGGGGSGRSRTLLSLLTQNFDSGTPFVYGNEDLSILRLLHNEAIARGQRESLYVINAFTTDAGKTNTFDPINPLVGHEAGFEAIFGIEFGRVLNQLCLCEHRSGRLVNFETLSDFLQINKLAEMSGDERYQSAKSTIDLYLAEVALEDDKSELRHAEFTERTRNFIRVLSDLPMCSFDPDIDFESVYAHKKYLYVMLPIFERSRDEREMVGALMLALASRYRPTSTNDSLCPSVIIDSVLDRHIYTVDLIKGFSGSNTIFSYWIEVAENEVGYDVFEEVTRTCTSFLIMKCESFFAPCLRGSSSGASRTSVGHRINERDVVGQGPGACIGFGHIFSTKRGLDTLITDLVYFHARYHELATPTEEFHLSQVKLRPHS